MKRACAIWGLGIFLVAGYSDRGSLGAAAPSRVRLQPSPRNRAASFNVYTYHNDYSRTGQNLSETTLTPSSVGGGTFGLMFNTGLVGVAGGSLGIRNQPLVVTGVNVGGTTHDLVLVATTASWVYGLDATGGQILWQNHLLPSAYGGSVAANDIFGGFTCGINSTPVIDPGSNTLYTCTHVQENSGGTVYDTWWLVALDVGSGAHVLGSPVLIASSIGDTYIGGPTPTVNGVGEGPSGQPAGQVAFDASQAGQRSALTLNAGSVWLPFSAPGSVNGPFHGWVLGFGMSSLQPTAVFCTTPNDPNSSTNGGGGIWGAGGGLVVDGGGNMYFATGNGLFDTTLDGNGFPNRGDYGDCIVKVAVDPSSGPNNQNVNGWGLRVVDYFTPHDTVFISAHDYDLASGSPIQLPNGEIVHAGKNSVVYVLDPNNMGHFDPGGDHVIQEIGGLVNCGQATPSYFNGSVYIIPTRNDNNPNSVYDALKQFAVQGDGTLSTNPIVGPHVYGYCGCSCAVSASGNSNGLIWAVDTGIGTSGVASLRASDAGNVASEIFSAPLPGPASSWATPTVANGWVYVPLTNGLAGYSLGSNAPPPPLSTIQDPNFSNQSSTGGAPLIPPWVGQGPALIGVDETSGMNGGKCGFIYDGNGTGAFSDIAQTISVTPNSTYTLSCFIQTDGTFPAQGLMGAETTGGTTIASQAYGQMTNYTQQSVTFNSGSNSSVIIFAGFTSQAGQGPSWIHVDSWSLSTNGTPPPPPPPSSGIGDPNFENQSTTGGSPLVAPWSGEGPAMVGVDDTSGMNGTKCAFIYDGSGTGAFSDIAQTISVTQNTTYTLSTFVQTDGSFPAQGLMGARTAGGAILASQAYGQTTNYTQLSVTFNSGSNSSVVIFCGLTGNLGQGPSWIHNDTWALASGGGPPPPPPPSSGIGDPNFENQSTTGGSPLVAPWSGEGPAMVGVDDTSGMNGTKCAFIFDGNGTGAFSDIVQTITLTANTTYTLSSFIQTDGSFPAQGLMGARTAGGTIIASQSYGQMTNYSQVRVTFNSGSNTSVVIFAGFTSNPGQGPAWIHNDTWALAAGGSTAPPPPPPPPSSGIGDPNFENQSTTGGSPLVAPWSGEGPALVGVDDTSGMNGTKCAFIYDGSGTGAFSDIAQTISVTPNTSYTLSSFVQTDGSFPAQGLMGARTVGGTILASQAYGQMTNYTQLSVTFNSGSNSSVVIFCGLTGNLGQGPSWIHNDTWALATGGGTPPPPPPSSGIGDPNFENQSTTGGSPLVAPWSGEGPALVGVDDTSGMNGTKCAFIYDGNGTGAFSDIAQTISVTPNTTYTLSCFIQTDGSFPAQGLMGARTAGGTILASQAYGQMTNYTQLSVTFNSGSNSSVVIFCGLTSNAGQGPSWIHNDTWSLAP